RISLRRRLYRRRGRSLIYDAAAEQGYEGTEGETHRVSSLEGTNPYKPRVTAGTARFCRLVGGKCLKRLAASVVLAGAIGAAAMLRPWRLVACTLGGRRRLIVRPLGRPRLVARPLGSPRLVVGRRSRLVMRGRRRLGMRGLGGRRGRGVGGLGGRRRLGMGGRSRLILRLTPNLVLRFLPALVLRRRTTLVGIALRLRRVGRHALMCRCRRVRRSGQPVGALRARQRSRPLGRCMLGTTCRDYA